MAARPPRTRALALDPPSGVASIARVLPSGRSLLVGFLLLAAAVGCYAAARGTSLFAVRSFGVQGAPPRVTGRVEAALAPLRGQSLLSVDAADVDRALAGLPDVKAIGLDRQYPGTLRVSVVAERPVAVLRRGSEAWLVSERGRVLQVLGARKPTALPRIWVAQLATPREGAILSAHEAVGPALTLGAVLTADPELLRRIREARIEGRGLELVLATGVEVRLGSPDDVPLKLAAANRVLETLPDARGGYLDVSVPERPVASLYSQVST